MNSLQAIILGFIQGATEFIPVSSSGHLIFFPKFLGWADQGLAFDVVVHLGTLLAVLIFFRKRIYTLLKGLCSKDKLSLKLCLMFAISIIPAGAVGLLFGNYIEQSMRSSAVVAFGLIFWGIVLFLADRFNKKQQNKASLENITWRNAICISFAQAIALIPGTSRSGITITAGLFSKLEKTAAAEFSFLMSIPVILVAGLSKVVELMRAGEQIISYAILSIGFVSSAISGFLAIFVLMKILEKWSLTPFVVYRIAVGVLILIFLV